MRNRRQADAGFHSRLRDRTTRTMADHGLDSIVATNIEDWHYEIPEGYFDNIGGTKAGKVLFI